MEKGKTLTLENTGHEWCVNTPGQVPRAVLCLSEQTLALEVAPVTSSSWDFTPSMGAK